MRLVLAALLAIPLSCRAEPADVRSALAASDRPAGFVALDAGRKPAEVLAFMGLQRGDRVIDYGAGGGYYTEILGRSVGPKGVVVGWNPPAFAAREPVREGLAGVRRRAPNVLFLATPSTAVSFPPNSFDLAVFHLSYHDVYWEDEGFGFVKTDPAVVTGAIFKALRPGGVVAVIDHVAAPGRGVREEVVATHRIEPRTVRADWERAGFVLDGVSELLRNPGDDRSKRVFDPTIRGRTDRFVYRFRKPGIPG